MLILNDATEREKIGWTLTAIKHFCINLCMDLEQRVFVGRFRKLVERSTKLIMIGKYKLFLIQLYSHCFTLSNIIAAAVR